MVFRRVLTVWLIAVAVCSASESSRIVGGQATTIEKHPSVVQVESITGLIWSQSCAGSILNTRYVLSAAQCFSGLLFSPSRRRIRAGTANRNRGGVILAVSRAFNHPTFSTSTLEGDLTIVQLSTAFVYGKTIQPGRIVTQNFVFPDDLPVTQVGWGSTRTSGRGTASVLREVQVYTANRQICAQEHASVSARPTVSENMLCTGVLGEGGRDACDGDEGGPVYYDDIIIGIISWRRRCGNATQPSVNTRVASYTNWIIINAS
uniref:Peptidase S1 domain-containing protein n=1 Tax=Pectinophora gossypiella TaxID=13191 RepID=A0A1E1WML3_PECGO